MASETIHCYLSALDSAAHAIEQARRIRPDPGLDHALDRLRALLLATAHELDEDAGCGGCGCARG